MSGSVDISQQLATLTQLNTAIVNAITIKPDDTWFVPGTENLNSARQAMLDIINLTRVNSNPPLKAWEFHDRLNGVAQHLAQHNASVQNSAHLDYDDWAKLMASYGMPDTSHWECTAGGAGFYNDLNQYPSAFMQENDPHRNVYFDLPSNNEPQKATHVGIGIAVVLDKDTRKPMWYIVTEHSTFPLINEALCGDYDCNPAPQPKNPWHTGYISRADNATLKWTNNAGVSWTLTTTCLRPSLQPNPTLLDVGPDCPYFTMTAANYTQVTVTWAGAVPSLSGPFGTLYVHQ